MTTVTAVQPPARRALNRPGLFVAWLVLLALFFVPATSVMDVSLDASNYGSYAYFAAHGFQYGTQVVPMAGPYGFVTYGGVYNGELFWVRVGFEFLLEGLLAGFILWLFAAARARAILRWGWLAAMLAFVPGLDDAHAEWLTLLAGAWLLAAPATTRHRAVAAVGALFPLLALLKGTHLYLVLATLGVVTLHALVARTPRFALALWAGFVGGFAGWWLLARQDLAHLPAFFRSLHELATGYNGAMGLVEAPAVFQRGLAAAVALALGLGWAAWRHRGDPRALAGLALVAGFAFVKWKHGFVRADGHVFVFFAFVVIAAFTWRLFTAALARAPGESRPAAFTGNALALLAALAGLAGISEGVGPRLGWILSRAVRMQGERLQRLATLPATKRELDAELAARRETSVLPIVRQLVGESSIDFFGNEHGIIPLNGLRYDPRPMSGGTFNVYTPHLMKMNGDFLRNPAVAPDYYLVKLGTIDNRLLAQDDALALRELISRYRPVAIDQGYVVARRVAEPLAAGMPILLEHREFHFGETVPVPATPPGQLVLAAFDLPPALPGRIRSFFYKPAPVDLTVRGDQMGAITHRLVPGMARVPLLLSPLLEDTADYLSLFNGTNAKRVTTLVVNAARPGDFSAVLGVTFYSSPAPAGDDGTIANLVSFLRFPLTNIPVDRIRPEITREKIVHGNLVQELQTPAEMAWRTNGTERELRFDFGFDPEAYQRGTTNGASYLVEIVQPDGGRQTVFRRDLYPRTVPADRGNHTAEVVLPPLRAGNELVLRIDPGPSGDNAWDWTYLARVQLRRGPPSLQQFPGFNRAPTGVDFWNCGAFEFEGHKFFGLAAPGSLTFALAGGETKLRFGFGILPGAYGPDGHTDGAGYTVTLERPGEAPRVIFRRLLDPRNQAADRGAQRAEMALPAIRAGDRLILAIDAGPAGNNSWDWTYVKDLVLD